MHAGTRITAFSPKASLLVILATVAIAWGASVTPSYGWICDDAWLSDCDTCCSTGDCSSCCPPWVHCCGVWGEFLYLHPTGADMAHAQQQNGTGGPGTVPFGIIGVADPTYQPGFRVGMNWAIDRCSSWMIGYTHFESDTRNLLPIGAGNAVGSLVQHPGAGIISSAGPLEAFYDINFQLADFRYRRLLLAHPCGWMNYNVGVRYGHLDQQFFQTGAFSGSQVGVIETDSDITFDGAGLFFGLDGEWLIGNRGFSVYSNIGVSPMVGQFVSEYTMRNASTNVLLANARWRDDRFVTILEYELGLAWTSANRLWRLSSGYHTSFWFNTVTTPEFIDAVRADNYVDVGDTLSFDGLTARIERRF